MEKSTFKAHIDFHGSVPLNRLDWTLCVHWIILRCLLSGHFINDYQGILCPGIFISLEIGFYQDNRNFTDSYHQGGHQTTRHWTVTNIGNF